MKLLIILSRVPYPLEKGDKLRAFYQLKELSKNNEIFLFAINDDKLHPQAESVLKNYCKELKIVSLSRKEILFNLLRSVGTKLPFQVGYFYNDLIQKELDKVVAEFNPDHIYCQLIRTAQYGIKYANIPKTLDYMDAFSIGMDRRKRAEPFFLRPVFDIEHRRLINYEREMFEKFNVKTIISKQDRNAISHVENYTIAIIPNGVDTDFFKPLERKKEYELIFNGNMNYPPNIESAEFLVKKILPIVRKKYPFVRLLISGSSPSSKILSMQSSTVTVSGWVDDIRENFAKCEILVAPMQISIGLQNKLLEAMAMQIPCVTSSLANKALGAQNRTEILVADTPEQYAQHIIDLLGNRDIRKRIALNGYNFVTRQFNWENSVKSLEKLMVKDLVSFVPAPNFHKDIL